MNKDCEELLEWAEEGDHKKVDGLPGDYRKKKTADDNDDSWYQTMGEILVLFSLGKLADDRFKGEHIIPEFAEKNKL